MTKISLTDVVLRSLQPPKQGQSEYWDQWLTNFGLRVSPGGTKSFVVYVNRRRKVIGHYPRMTLKEARTKAKKILFDPAAYEQPKQLEVAYTEAVDRYLQMKALEVSERTLEEYTRQLRMISFSTTVNDIRPYQVDDALQRVVGRTNRSHAFTNLKVFFNWCVGREYCASNPMAKLRKPKLPPARERVLSDEELRLIWKACNELGKYGVIVQVLMLTGQRKAQIASLHASWVQKQAIVFPASIMKNRREHYCPIGPLTELLLRGVLQVEGYYFSPITAVGRPFSNWSKSKKQLDDMVQIDPWVLHDLRRTWSTNAPRLGIEPQLRNRILSHTTPEGAMAKIYDRYAYRKEMAAAMHKMNDHFTKEIL